MWVPLIWAAASGAQEQRRRGDLLDRDELLGRLLVQHDLADHRRAVHVVRLHLVGDLRLDQRRQHIARADRIAGDACRRDLERDRLGEAHDAVFGRDVGRLERRGDQPVRGRDVDDAAPAGLRHQRDGRGGRVERRGQVDGNDRIPFLGRKFLDRRDMLDAGIVDEDVDRAEFLGRLLDQRPAVGALRHVGLDVDDLGRMLLGDRLGDRMVLRRVGEGIDHHIAAVGGKRIGDGKPDARGRAGDDRGLLGHAHETFPRADCRCCDATCSYRSANHGGICSIAEISRKPCLPIAGRQFL